jgi:uncharacterized membrane protein
MIRVEAAPQAKRGNHAVGALHQQNRREFRRDVDGRQQYRAGGVAAREQHRNATAPKFNTESFDSGPRAIRLRQQECGESLAQQRVGSMSKFSAAECFGMDTTGFLAFQGDLIQQR